MFRKMVLLVIGSSLLVGFSGFLASLAQAQSPVLSSDVTSKLEYLGTPSTKTALARNVWDMMAFNNKIYIGSGDTGKNAGPIPIMAYTPASGTFANEFTVDEEQINSFTLVDGILTIPGDDSREGWDLGNYYQLINGTWTKFRKLPGGIHVYDIFSYNGKLFAALGTTYPTRSVAVSQDNGLTWKAVEVPAGSNIQQPVACASGSTTDWVVQAAFRTGYFFTIGSELYAHAGTIYEYACINGRSTARKIGSVVKWNGQGFVVDSIDLFQDSTITGIKRPTKFGAQTLYLVTKVVTTGDLAQPVGLRSVDDNRTVRKITLPNCDFPYDIVVRPGRVFVLCNKNLGSSWRISVHTSTDAQNWTEVFYFTMDTYARSFEELNGDFYFGLGSNYNAISDSNGKIYRVKVTGNNPSPSPNVCQGDINNDNQVNLSDYSLFVQAFFKAVATQPRADLNGDGQINLSDYSLLVARFLKPC